LSVISLKRTDFNKVFNVKFGNEEIYKNCSWGGSVAEWLACWTQAQMGPGSNRSRDAVGLQSWANYSHPLCLCSPSSKIGSSPLKGCRVNYRPGGKKWQPTAGFMTHVTCRLTTKNRDQLRNLTLGNRVWATLPLSLQLIKCTISR